METGKNDPIKLTERTNRRLGYAQEFKDMLHEHPGKLFLLDVREFWIWNGTDSLNQ